MNYKSISKDFGHAASSYAKNAILQFRVASNLVNFAKYCLNDTGRILDAGSGTGFLSYLLEGKEVIGIDIALPMCKQAAEENGGLQVNGNIENLPFEDHSFETVFSSLVLQWTAIDKALAEIARVLKEKGRFIFSILCSDTLHEFSKSLSEFDSSPRINRFPELKNLTAKIEKHFEIEKHIAEDIIIEYADIFELAKKIREIGARNKTSAKSLAKSQAKKINEFYKEHYGTAAGIKATWDVHYFIVKKV